MAESLGRILKNEVQEKDQVLLLGHLPNWNEKIDALVFSGGISECMYNHEPDKGQKSNYDDIGDGWQKLFKGMKCCKAFHGWSLLKQYGQQSLERARKQQKLVEQQSKWHRMNYHLRIYLFTIMRLIRISKLD